MTRLRWTLLAVAVLAGVACAAAAAAPGLRPLGDGAVVVAGFVTAAVLAAAGGSRHRAWQLLAVAPLFPVAGTVVAAFVHPADPAQVAVLRWVPTVPGYVVAVVAILGLAGRARLRTGARGAVELALFVTACLVVVQLLVVGPRGRWSGFGLDERLILGAAVLATSLTMAAALTVLGVIESHRRRMALSLLAGGALLTAGRGLGTSALLSGSLGAADASRFLVLGGLSFLTLAVLLDPGPQPGDLRPRPQSGRSTELGQLLPHAAMLVAAVTITGVWLLGAQPSGVTGVLALACVALAAVHRWVTARDEQRLGARLRHSEAYFRSLVSASGDAVVILDDELRITWASPALGRFLGDAAAPLTGRVLLDVVHPEDVAELAAALPESPDGGAAEDDLLRLRLQDADGGWRRLEAGVSDLRRDADVAAVVLHCRDVTERAAREETLHSVAYTDFLTGLPNRAGFLRALHGVLAEPVDPDARVGTTLLMIELQGLADAREHAGLEVVTGVEAEVGRRLRGTVRGGDVVARLGGGAFVVLASSTATEVDQLADRCLAVVEQPIVTPVGIIDLTASIGLVVLEPGLREQDLLGRASLAVRAARAGGPGSAARYVPALGEAAARQERLRTDLQGARARGELFLLWQPIVSLGEQRVTGVEAQLGWRHPELGDVPAAEFLPIAERAGFIAEIQRWALEEVARAAAELPTSGDAPLRIGMDVPAGYLAGGTLVADVEAALTRTGVSPEQFVLEIGEDAVLSGDERVALDIATVRLMGVHVALDHFGTGHSALANLTRLPIDILKLDRSFLTRVDRDAQARALCESVVGIGRALGVDVVAEGVETPAQLATLCGFTCGFAQGFLLSRPLPLGEVRRLLEDRAGILWPGLVGQRKPVAP